MACLPYNLDNQTNQSVCAFVDHTAETPSKFCSYIVGGADELGGQTLLNQVVNTLAENVALPKLFGILAGQMTD